MGDVSPGEKDASLRWAKFYASNWSFRNKETGKLKKRWIAIIATVVVLLTATLITLAVTSSSGLLDKGSHYPHSDAGGSSDDDSDGPPDPDEVPKPFVAKLAHLVQPL